MSGFVLSSLLQFAPDVATWLVGFWLFRIVPLPSCSCLFLVCHFLMAMWSGSCWWSCGCVCLVPLIRVGITLSCFSFFVYKIYAAYSKRVRKVERQFRERYLWPVAVYCSCSQWGLMSSGVFCILDDRGPPPCLILGRAVARQ